MSKDFTIVNKFCIMNLFIFTAAGNNVVEQSALELLKVYFILLQTTNLEQCLCTSHYKHMTHYQKLVYISIILFITDKALSREIKNRK